MMRTAKVHVANYPLDENSEVDDRQMFTVTLIEDDEIVEVRELPGKSRAYADDLVENWETGVLQLLNE